MKCRNLHRFIMLLPYITALFNIGVVQAALDNKGCFMLISDQMRHYTYREYLLAASFDSCFQECRMSAHCNSFSYSPDPGLDRNCLLSDSIAEENSIQDRSWSIFNLKVCDSFGKEQISDVECFKMFAKRARLADSVIHKSLRTFSLDECKFRCRDDYHCTVFFFTLSSEINCHISEAPNIDQYIESDDSSDVFSNTCMAGRESTTDWTVSGSPCATGSCRMNPDVGYWYCEVMNDVGWDYCCRPGERCGYGNNERYPWCYVGDTGSDQWRPCKL